VSAKIPVIGPVVYYVRRGRYIKIGHAVDLRRRMRDLYRRADDVLAIEHGSRITELERHEQFADDRVHWRAENFRESPALLAHIARLRDETPVPYDTLRPRPRRAERLAAIPEGASA
jgi:hypothetical protein